MWPKGFFLMFAGPALAGLARAEVALARADDTLGACDFVSENDVYGHWGDRYYTSGLRLAYVSPPVPAGGADSTRRWWLGAAQEMYTPLDRYASNPPEGDHPYSAWTYATGGFALADAGSLDLFTLSAGVVGPSALGKQSQNNYHRLIGVKPLNGWDTQLHDEPGVDAAWLRVWRVALTPPGRGWGAQALPRVSGELGTVRTRATAGIQLRFGKNLPEDFGEFRMRDGLTGASPVAYRRESRGGWAPDAWYVFLDAQGEAYARNMALDGNLWHDSRSVDSRPVVGQFFAGVAAHWGAARVSFTQVLRTEEFRGQKDRPFMFGAVMVTVTR